MAHARDLGWRNLKNGELLASAAAAGFDAMLTIDKNIRYQQNLTRLPIGIVELDVVRNRLADVAALAPHFPSALERLAQFKFVSLKSDGLVECLVPRN